MTNNDKPNAVLFKLETNQLCIVLLKDDKWDWINMLHLDMEPLKSDFDDLSTSNPFEFVFCYWYEDKFSTGTRKVIIPNQSFLKLIENDTLQKTIEAEYNNI